MQSNTMLTAVYGLWFVNQFLVLIILLNFLIAVISQSYEKVKNSAIILEYQDRCELNREAHQVFNEYERYRKAYNRIIISVADVET